MAGIIDMVAKFAKLAQELPKERQKLALLFAHDAHALTANRIQNTGVNARGEKMRPYSKNPLPLFFFNGNKTNATSKADKFKKDVAKGLIKSSYENFRKAYGLQTAFRDLTFDGDMWASIHQEVESHDANQTTVVIKSRDGNNQKIVNYNSKQNKTNILAFGKEEKKLLLELNKERIGKLIKSL